MRPRSPAWLRSAARRPAAALTLAVLAAVAAFGAVGAPILARAVEQAALTRALTGSTVLQRSVVGVVPTQSVDSLQAAEALASQVTAAVRHPRLWGPAQVIPATTGDALTWGAGQRVRERLVGAADCSGLVLTAGRCVAARGEVLLPAATAARHGAAVGDRIAVTVVPPVQLRLVVVGLYDASSGRGALLAAPERLTTAPTGVTEPDAVVAPAQLTDRLLSTTAFAVRTLRPGTAVAAVADVRADLAAASRVALGGRAAAGGLSVSSRLPELLDAVDGQRTAARTVLGLIALQALVLGWAALAAVVLQAVRARSAEAGLLRLRGVPRARRIRIAVLEPAVALLVGCLVGALAAAGVAPVLGRSATGVAVPGTTPEALLVAGLVAAGGLVAIAVVMLLGSRRPLPVLLRSAAEPRRASRPLLVGQVVLLVLTAAAVQVALAGGGDPLALLAPALVALSLAAIALRAAVVAVRRRSSRSPTGLAGLVLIRAVARTPSRLGSAVVVTVGVALAVLVLQAVATTDRLAEGAARARAAAPVVLHVRTPDGVELLDAVARADPAGRSAMAAEELDGSHVQRVVAVDTARLAAVSTWSSAWAGSTPAQLLAALAPSVGPVIAVRGTRLTLAIADVRRGPIDGGGGPFTVSVELQTPDRLVDAVLGAVSVGAGGTVSGSIPCAVGCRLVSVGATNPATLTWSAAFTVRSMRTDEQDADVFAADLTTSGRWAPLIGRSTDPTQRARSSATAAAAGLRIALEDPTGGLRPAVRVADTVQPLPAVVTARTGPQPFPGVRGAVYGSALDRTPLLLRVVGSAPVLPRALGDGVLVDLRLVERQSDAAAAAADREVWVTAAAAGRVRRALQQDGVRVTGVETLAGWRTRYRDQAGPESARLAQLSGVAALALAIVAAVGLQAVAAAGRRSEWASYRSGGARPGRVRRLAALEFLLPGAGGALLGAAAGLLGAAVVRARVPLFDESAGVPPVSGAPPWTVAAVVLLTVGLLAVAALPVSAAVVREDRP